MIYSKTVATLKRLLPAPFFDFLAQVRRLAKGPHPDAALFVAQVQGKSGVEIGGPSSLFRLELPVYAAVKDLVGAIFPIRRCGKARCALGRHSVSGRDVWVASTSLMRPTFPRSPRTITTSCSHRIVSSTSPIHCGLWRNGGECLNLRVRWFSRSLVMKAISIIGDPSPRFPTSSMISRAMSVRTI